MGRGLGGEVRGQAGVPGVTQPLWGDLRRGSEGWWQAREGHSCFGWDKAVCSLQNVKRRRRKELKFPRQHHKEERE